MNEPTPGLVRIVAIAQRDSRYKVEAYLFVIEALNHELGRLGLSAPERRRHLTARELLSGIKDLGWERYGRLAKDVFESWGVKSTRDFGEIVFNLVDAKELSKTDEDKIEDFDEAFDFLRDLVQSYQMGERDEEGEGGN